MRFGYFALCLAIPSVVACGGDSPDQSFSGVFPSSAFLGRQVRVEVTGDVTSWDDGVMVSFGDAASTSPDSSPPRKATVPVTWPMLSFFTARSLMRNLTL